MRKWLSAMLAFALGTTMAAHALAEEQTSFEGKLEPGYTVSVTAPFGGTVRDFAWKVGDQVKAGDVLLTLSTTRVYADVSGTLVGLRAEAGDKAAVVSSQYGALAYIEPLAQYRITADTSERYKDDKQLVLHIGQAVYLQSTSDSGRTGMGRIITLEGNRYTVEVLSGNLHNGEKCGVFTDADHEAKSRIGRGMTVRQNAIPVTGDGSVLAVYAADGAYVEKGALLFELVTGVLDTDEAMSADVIAPVDGVITAIQAAVGGQAAEDQVLMTLYPTGTLQAAVYVEERDLGNIAAGDLVEISLDCMDGAKVYHGTVTAISSVSSTAVGDAAYTAYVTFDNDAFVRAGMSVTVRRIR